MYDETMALAENKLLVLYVMQEIKLSVSNNQLTQIMIETNMLSYFTLQQYIFDLINSNLLEYVESNGKQRLAITSDGLRVLDLFKNRISETKKAIIDAYLSNQIDNIKKELTITSDYTVENDNNFIVNLKAIENDIILMDIKLSVASNKQARDICAKWKNNSSELYSNIINLLISD